MDLEAVFVIVRSLIGSTQDIDYRKSLLCGIELRDSTSLKRSKFVS
jgi:hypothetical protein